MANQPLFLRVVKNGKAVEIKQFNDEQIVIGNSGDATLNIHDPKAGAIHCMVEERDGKFFLCDLGTEHGTFHKDKKVVETSISSGDEFTIGDTTIEFHVGIPKPFKGGTASAAPVSTPKTPPAAPPTSAPQKPLVTVAPPPAAPLKTKVTETVKYTPPPSHAAPQPPPPKKSPGASAGGMSLPTYSPRPKRPGTFAPPSSPKVKENLKPSQGTIVEVVLFWKDRVLATHHFDKNKVVKIGSHPDNDIILPIFGSVRLSHALLKIEALARVFITQDMTGEIVKKDGGRVSFLDLKRMGSMQPAGTGFSYQLQQNEMAKIQIGEGVEIAIRYVGSVPASRTVPIIDMTVNQITALIVLFLITFLFLFYVFLYAPPLPEKPEEETIPPRKAQFFYKRPVEEIKPVEVSPEPEKHNAPETIVDKEKAPARGEEGAAHEARPNKSQSNKQILTSDKAGKDKGIQKNQVNNKNSATQKTVVKDVTKSGILSVFGTKGVQDQLNKAYQGSGKVAGLSQGATGQGAETAGAGVTTGAGMKELGQGGNGTATVGIAGIKTAGRGGGKSGYGVGPLGAKKNATIFAGGDGEFFPGSIDKEAIRRVVQAHLKEIKACYEKGLNRDPSLYGKIVISWVIGNGGNVVDASIKSTTLNSPDVEKCAVSRLRTWKFPEPPAGEQAQVSYPFVLEGQE